MFTSYAGLVVSLFLVALLSYLEKNGLMIIFMVLYLMLFQFGIGTISFIHIFETNVDSIIGFANQTPEGLVWFKGRVPVRWLDESLCGGGRGGDPNNAQRAR